MHASNIATAKMVESKDDNSLVIFPDNIGKIIKDYDQSKTNNRVSKEMQSIKLFYKTVQEQKSKLSGENLAKLASLLISFPAKDSPKSQEAFKKLRALFPGDSLYYINWLKTTDPTIDPKFFEKNVSTRSYPLLQKKIEEAIAGDAKAHYYLFECFCFGKEGAVVHPRKLLFHLEQAYHLIESKKIKDPEFKADILNNLVWCYENGNATKNNGTKINLEKANTLRVANAAKDKFDLPVTIRSNARKFEAEGDLRINSPMGRDRAYEYYVQGALCGLESCREILCGTSKKDGLENYLKGKEFEAEQNYVEALKCYQASADKSYPLAFFEVGRFYEIGLGTAINVDSANAAYQAVLKIEFPSIYSHFYKMLEIAQDKARARLKLVEMMSGLSHLKKIAYQEFKFGEQLGSGGFSTVYKVLNEPVAVKEAHFNHRSFIAYQKHAAFFLKNIQHPNLLKVTGYCLYPPMYAMEFSSIGTLETYAATHSLDYITVVILALQIAMGLARMHQEGCVHGDLKGANVLLFLIGEMLTVKIADFDATDEENGRVYVSTPGFCAPERSVTKTLTKSGDVYSWHATVLEMMKGGKLEDTSIPHPCPKPLLEILLDCRHTNPSERPTMKQVCTRLKELVEQTSPKPLSSLLSDPVFLSESKNIEQSDLLDEEKFASVQDSDSDSDAAAPAPLPPPTLIPAASSRDSNTVSVSEDKRNNAGLRRHWHWLTLFRAPLSFLDNLESSCPTLSGKAFRN